MIQERIIAALLNATWQTVAITLISALGLRVFARTSASARCAIWTGVLLIAVALPFVDIGALQSVKLPQQQAAAIAVTQVASATVGVNANPSSVVSNVTQFAEPPARPQTVRPLLALAVHRTAGVAFLVWLGGMAFFGARFLFSMACLFLAKNAIEPMGNRGVIQLGISDRVAVPCLLGFLRPVIAVPRALASELCEADLERIILHESAHLARRDDWFNLLEQVALVVFFFNPAIHYIAHCIGMEREIACDDHVIAKSENRINYAECLTQLAHRCSNRRALGVPGFFTNRRQIMIRIEQLLDRGHNGSQVVGRRTLAAIGAIAIAGLFLSQLGIPVIAANITCPNAKAPFTIYKAPVAFVPQSLRMPQATRVIPAVAHPQTVRRKAVHACACVKAHTAAKVREHSKVHAAPPPTNATAQTSSRAEMVSEATAADAAATVSEVSPVQSQDAGSSEGKTLAGYNGFTVDQVIELHDHGVTPAMLAEFKAAGYVNLTSEQLIKLRDHSVSAAFAQSMNAMAHTTLGADDLVALRDHGVSMAYAADMSAHGLRIMTVEDLIILRDHGVSGQYLADLAKAGYGGISVADAIRLRDHGVSGAFVAHIRHDLNPGTLSIDELIRLRDAGI